MPGYVNTGLNFVHVDDIASGHLAALEYGKIGEQYVLGGEDVELYALLAEIARLCGRRPPRLRIPRRAVFPVAFAAQTLALFTRKEPFITADGLRMAKNHMFADSAKARRDLRYNPRPYVEGVADAIRWFREAGYLP
jgi:dihydroflavonol-4-reductase